MRLFLNFISIFTLYVSQIYVHSYLYIEKENVEKYMEKIIYTCLKVLIDEKCDEVPESFKGEVGKFIKNVVMNSGEQSLLLLRDLESKMSTLEKESLARYV